VQVWLTPNSRLSLGAVLAQGVIVSRESGLGTTGLFHYIYKTELEPDIHNNYTVRNFIMCIPHKILLERSNEGGGDGLSMQNIRARSAHKILDGNTKGNGSYIILEGMEWTLSFLWAFSK
jgi:hypothetical protein